MCIRDRGRDALAESVRAMKIPEALDKLSAMFGRMSKEMAQDTKTVSYTHLDVYKRQDYHIIQECIADGVIFESNGRYHNAVFVGKDETGTPKYAAYRGLGSSTFKGDAYGSDKQYSFRLLAKEPCQSVHLFEAAIDLLSYATLLKAQGKDYKAENLLSPSGVYQPKKENKDSKIPIALSVFLEKNPLIKTIHLHLDNDKTGRLCANTLKELLRNKYEVFDEPPKKGKDYNDYLCIQLGIYKSKERSYER